MFPSFLNLLSLEYHVPMIFNFKAKKNYFMHF